MVKNTTGGKHKNQARKHSYQTSSHNIPLSTDPNECYAIVNKMSGNSMCRVDLLHNQTLLKNVCCHIRGKFKHKNKKHNFVNTQSKLLVGLREWASDNIHCDLLFIYNDHDTNNISQFSIISPNNSFEQDDIFYNNNNHNNIDSTTTHFRPYHENENENDFDLDLI